MKNFSDSQSDKQRILHAVSIIMENDNETAAKVLETTRQKSGKYLMQGAALTDIELMEELDRDSRKKQ